MVNEGYNSFRLFMPAQASGADLVYWDMFNRTDSGIDVLVFSVIPVVSGAAGVTGVVSVDLFLTRTSAVGTGGTAATIEGTSLTAATISNMLPKGNALNGGVTARLTPSGGATAGAVISSLSLFSEETNAGTYLSTLNDFVRRNNIDHRCLLVTPNTGIRIVQGSVASVGNTGFDVMFQTRPR